MQKIRKLLCFLCCLSVHNGKSQLPGKPVTSYYAGMGSYTQNHVDVFSFISNQASLAQLKNSSAGVYSEQRFLLKELSSYTTAIALPTPAGGIGATASFVGQSAYSEAQAGLAFGRKIGNKMDLGIQFNYRDIRIPGYGNASAWNVEMGAILHLVDKLQVGLQINNPAGGHLSNGNPSEKLPAIFTLGWCYEASEHFYCIAQVIKQEDQLVTIHAGLEYVITSQLFVRLGIVTATSSVYTGIGLTWKKIRVDITSNYHPQLGMTPGLLLLFTIN